MRIVFVICSFGHGKGGHFHSLRVIAEALQERADCMILNIGLSPSAVLAESSVEYVFQEFDGWHPLACARSIHKTVSRFEPNVIHSFDRPAHSWARLLGQRFDIPVIHTKCGGPNPREYYPSADCLINFSIENYRFFQQSRKHNRSRIEHIPNRSNVVKADSERIGRLAKLSREGSAKIMRIARFSLAYKRGLLKRSIS